MSKRAVAVFSGEKINGTVYFTEELVMEQVRIDVSISGLSKSAHHGFHVHEYGDMSDHCESMCAHFNPYHTNHGCPGAEERHVGDLGNLITDKKGKVIKKPKDRYGIADPMSGTASKEAYSGPRYRVPLTIRLEE